MELMAEWQWKRWEAVARLGAGKLTLQEAARVLQLSVRRVRRVRRAVDDASGELLPGGHFVEQECAAAYFGVLRAVVTAHGVPWSIYMDQHGALQRNDDHWTPAEELRGKQDPTQVGQALQALEIEAIYALSPQAKGRVERLWGTLQERLVSELRLAGARMRREPTADLERNRHVHHSS